MRKHIKIVVIAILIFGLSSISLFAGSAIEINRATYNEITTTLTLDGLNFGFFGQPTISIGDSILSSCSVGETIIECNIDGTPAVGGGSFHVKVSAGNSPHTNAMIDVYIPEGSAECSPGEMAICYSGDPATLNVAECAVGYRFCQDDGTWGSCGGEVTPTNEVCDGVDNDCDGLFDEDAIDAITFYEDLDGDGFGKNFGALLGCEPPGQQYIESGGDCNDNSPDIYPGAQEYCDGADDDCDGEIDNGGTCIADGDNDGYFADIDCDDSNPDIYPGQDETCDGFDNDCDGEIDEDALDQIVWFADGDGDGFGNRASSPVLTACYPPEGTQLSSNNYDCDDSNSSINPDAEEICNDIDDNCNYVVDDGFNQTQWFYDGDGDGFGGHIKSSILSCTQPGPQYVTNHDDCADTDPLAFPGQTMFFDTTINGSYGYDYDCNGVQEIQYTYFANYEWNFGCEFYTPGWSPNLLSAVPNCGYTAPWVISASGILFCEENTTYLNQGCR